MESSPPGICGYEWPGDCERVGLVTDTPISQSCCFRPVVSVAAGRCRWHADLDAAAAKTPDALAAACPEPAIREQTSPIDQLLDGAVLAGCSIGDAVPLADTALGGADFTGADLAHADLTNAGLGNAVLADADLSGATLHNAGLSEADLSGADLSGADLTDSLLWRTDLSGANLSGADLSDAFLWGADLTDADLTDADLTDADFEDADLTGTNLNQATLWASQ
jgi:hypothetical protein